MTERRSNLRKRGFLAVPLQAKVLLHHVVVRLALARVMAFIQNQEGHFLQRDLFAVYVVQQNLGSHEENLVVFFRHC